jgi:hypothetical protein
MNGRRDDRTSYAFSQKQEETKRGANFYADSPKRGVAAKTKPLPPEPAPDSPPKESTDFEDGVSETEVEKYALHLGMDPKVCGMGRSPLRPTCTPPVGAVSREAERKLP